MKLKEGDMVLVEWDDIVAKSSWSSLDELRAKSPSKCKDLGFFLEDDGKVLRIMNSMTDEGEVGYTVFPKGCVTRIKKLREV